MRLIAAVLALVLIPLAGLADNPPSEQTITAIPADTEQRIEVLTPPGEQHVEALDADSTQRISEGTTGPVGRGFKGVTKVVVGVLAAGVSLGVMAASLLLI